MADTDSPLQDVAIQAPDVESRYNFSFSGEIELIYQDFKVDLDRAAWRIFFQGESPDPVNILLDLRFLPASAQRLARYFPLLEGAENDILSYTFGLKRAVLAAHAQALGALDADADSWLPYGEALLMRLENYHCLGHGSFDEFEHNEQSQESAQPK